MRSELDISKLDDGPGSDFHIRLQAWTLHEGFVIVLDPFVLIFKMD
jgi:hypothetical protein